VSLAQRVAPHRTATEIFDCLGVAGLFVMSEEWWDPSVIDMYPRMPTNQIPALMTLRRTQLRRLSALGLNVEYTWYDQHDTNLHDALSVAIFNGYTVGLVGVVAFGPLRVSAVHTDEYICVDHNGSQHVILRANMRAPAGIACLVMSESHPTHRQDDDAVWIRYLLHEVPSMAFDTPRHPLRDWQVWHIGVDALAVAAYSAETAAPLAIVSDNVARIAHTYAWRLAWLAQQLPRMHAQSSDWSVGNAMNACADAQFFLGFVTRHYPLTVERRALTLAEGALIAEACRDARQALQGVVAALPTE